jgi:membrane protein required for beta-lactamase induction
MTTTLLSLIALFLGFLTVYVYIGGRQLSRDIAGLAASARAAAERAAVIAENLAEADARVRGVAADLADERELDS